MWLSLDTEIQYRFEKEISPVDFFEHLPNLLDETDILVLGCYDARSDIFDFLRSEALPPRWNHFHPIETWDANRVEHPNGASFHLPVDTQILKQLGVFASTVTTSIDLCDHIAAYSPEHPLLIYHGTFWEPLYISTRIPRARVEAFSRNIEVPFDEIDFFKTFDLVPPSQR